MIPTDADIAAFFTNAMPFTDLYGRVGKETAVVKAACGSSILPPEILLRFLRSMVARDGARMRVSLDDRYFNNREQVDLARTVRDSDTMDSWTEREIGTGSVNFIFNGLETADEALATAVARYIAPVIRHDELAAFDVSTYSGRYPFSALGIHSDVKADGVVHFHFGPGPKQLFFWPEGTKPIERPNLAPPEDIIATANRIDVEPGDGLLINGNDYHVAEAKTLTTSVVLIGMYANAWDEVATLGKQLDWTHSHKPVERHAPSIKPGLNFPKAWWRLSMEQIVETVDQLVRMRHSSNGGLLGSPTELKSPVALDGEITITTPDVFPLCFAESHGQLVVAARGRVRPLTLCDGVTRFLEDLRDGRSILIAEIRAAAKVKGLEGEVVMFLQWLLGTRCAHRLE